MRGAVGVLNKEIQILWVLVVLHNISQRSASTGGRDALSQIAYKLAVVREKEGR